MSLEVNPKRSFKSQCPKWPVVTVRLWSAETKLTSSWPSHTSCCQQIEAEFFNAVRRAIRCACQGGLCDFGCHECSYGVLRAFTYDTALPRSHSLSAVLHPANSRHSANCLAAVAAILTPLDLKLSDREV